MLKIPWLNQTWIAWSQSWHSPSKLACPGPKNKINLKLFKNWLQSKYVWVCLILHLIDHRQNRESSKMSISKFLSSWERGRWKRETINPDLKTCCLMFSFTNGCSLIPSNTQSIARPNICKWILSLHRYVDDHKTICSCITQRPKRKQLEKIISTCKGFLVYHS